MDHPNSPTDTTAKASAAQLQQETLVKDEMEEFYQSGPPPWDTNVSPPELKALVTGTDSLPPGRALELGCGTGTNAIFLAHHGWDVVAVDLVDRAIEQAHQKAESAGVTLRALSGDATRLDALGIDGTFDLFFDLGCYCGIPEHRRDAYVNGLTERSMPGSQYLMFGYSPEAFDDSISGVTTEELIHRFAGWNLVEETPGTNSLPTTWYRLERTSD